MCLTRLTRTGPRKVGYPPLGDKRDQSLSQAHATRRTFPLEILGRNMASKELMRNLSRRLEPTREEFRLRLYHWSIGILEQQVSDDGSLFWKLPSRVIRNLHKLLKIDDDGLRFFLVRHGCRNRQALSRLGQPVPSHEEETEVMKRCIDPAEPDVRRSGLLPLSTPVSRLNKRKLKSAIRARLSPIFEEKIDHSEPDERSYETRTGAWQIVALVDTGASYSQAEIEFDVRLGMGDLYLERQVSLHRLFGIGPTAWDLARPGDEEGIAHLIEEYCRFMVTALSSLLKELDPGISREEVVQAEEEWKQ
jgi:hypothetical protein